MHTTCGTLNYIAPEIVKNTGYDGQMADIWACGVILYFMLTGRRPFDDDSVHKLLDKIIVGDFKFPSQQLMLSRQASSQQDDTLPRVNISDEAKDLVKRILNPNPRKRFTIEQIMMHPWMMLDEDDISQGDEEEEEGMEDDDLDNRDEEWSQSDINGQQFQLPDYMSLQQQQQSGNPNLLNPYNNMIGSPAIPINGDKTGHNAKGMRTMQQVPSDYMSFSTFYHKDQYGGGGTTGKRRMGARKANCFELLNFFTGRHMTSVFDIKGKKKDILQPSPFPKKKQQFKIAANPGPDSGGLHIKSFFFSFDPITTIFDSMLEEMTKFQDPIIIPESQIYRLVATYYRVKPSVGCQSQPPSQIKSS